MSEKKPKDQESTPEQNDQNTQQVPAVLPQPAPTPEPQQAPAPTPEPLKAKPEEPKKLDETVPGGRYKTADGRYVNANGEELK